MWALSSVGFLGGPILPWDSPRSTVAGGCAGLSLRLPSMRSHRRYNSRKVTIRVRSPFKTTIRVISCTPVNRGPRLGLGGFASFSSYDLGLQAMKNQIQLDADRGTDVTGKPTTTIAQLIASWAPPSQNDTAAYVSAVSSSTGYDPNAPLSSLGTSDFSFDPAVSSGRSDSGGFDLSSITDSTVDLSGLGLSSSVSTPLLIGGGLVGLLVLSRIF